MTKGPMTYFKGVKVEAMTREQLIEALQWCAQHIQDGTAPQMIRMKAEEKVRRLMK